MSVPTYSASQLLELLTETLGMDVRMAEADITTVGMVGHGNQASHYAEVFARRYNDLVGMGGKDDMKKLHDGMDPRGTGPFLRTLLQENDCRSVIDVCSGCQYDVLYFAGAAARGELPLTTLVSNEMDDALFAQGERNLQAAGVLLFPSPTFTHYPWQELADHFDVGEFDACLCTGNSLSHISDPAQRAACIDNFATITKNMLVVDTRNFSQMLANADELMSRAKTMLRDGSFGGGNRQLFPGNVANFPVYITRELVVMAYVKRGESSPYALVQFSPLPDDVLRTELQRRFGKVETYYNKSSEPVSAEVLRSLDGPSTVHFVCTEPAH